MARAETLGQSPKGKHGWQIMAAALGVPAALLAGWLYLGRGKGPTNVEGNPDLPGAGLVLPEFTPILVPAATEVRPTPTFTPEPTATPEVNYVAEAMKRGKLELKGEGDWEKYFTAVTPEEAEILLNKTNAEVTNEADFKFLFPLDPRQAPNLILETIDYPSNPIMKGMLGMRKILPGTIFYMPLNGEARYMTGSIIGDVKAAQFAVRQGDSTFGFAMPLVGVKSLIPESSNPQQTTQVKIGTPLAYFITDDYLGSFTGSQQKEQLTFYFVSRVVDQFKNDLSQLLTKNNKIVFIVQAEK